MKKTRHTQNQVTEKLSKVEPGREGQTIAETVRALGVGENTYYRWKREYGSTHRDQLKRLKDLGKENKRLKKIAADLSLDKAILKKALEKNTDSDSEAPPGKQPTLGGYGWALARESALT